MKAPTVFLALLLALCWTSCDPDQIQQSNTYVVDYIPSQCAPEPSSTLGLRSMLNDYYLVQDQTGQFEKLEQGDRVRVEFEFTDEMIVCLACTCPAPDGAMKIHSLEVL